MILSDSVKDFNERLAYIGGQMTHSVLQRGYDKQPAMTQEIKDVIKYCKENDKGKYLAVKINSVSRYVEIKATSDETIYVKNNSLIIPILEIDTDCKRYNYKEIWQNIYTHTRNTLNTLIEYKIKYLYENEPRHKVLSFIQDMIDKNYYIDQYRKYYYENVISDPIIKQLLTEAHVIIALTENK